MSWIESLPSFDLSEAWSENARAAALLARKRNAALRGGPLARGAAVDHETLEKHGHELVGEGAWSAAVPDHVDRLRKSDALDLDTQKLHTDAGGRYSAERRALHRKIVALHLRGHAPGVKGREAVFMGGGPASGKSSLLRSGAVSVPHDSVLVNPDVIKNMIPEYRRLLAAGDTSASAKVHEESSHIAEQIRTAALKRQHHLVVDKVKIKPEHVAEARASGHSPRGIIATAPTDVAVARAEKRGTHTGRYVDEKVVRDGHREASARFPDVVRSGIPLEVHDTERNQLIATAEKGRVTVHKQRATREFYAKAREFG